MRLKLAAASGALCFVLAGCVAGGVKVEERQLSSFQKGQTTVSQVVGQLGSPNSSTLLPDGRRMLMYTYIQAQARPESFVPIVGAFIGGADSHSTMVSLTFTRDGVLESYSSTQTQYGMSTGLAGGSNFEGRTDQPRITATPTAATAEVPSPQRQSESGSAPTPSGRACTHDEQVKARIARSNGYTGGPKCD
jgi:hypothetical protein